MENADKNTESLLLNNQQQSANIIDDNSEAGNHSTHSSYFLSLKSKFFLF